MCLFCRALSSEKSLELEGLDEVNVPVFVATATLATCVPANAKLGAARTWAAASGGVNQHSGNLPHERNFDAVYRERINNHAWKGCPEICGAVSLLAQGQLYWHSPIFGQRIAEDYRNQYVTVRSRPFLTGSGAVGLKLIRNGPRKELADAIDWMLGDASNDVAQIGFRVETVQFCCRDQGVDCGSPFAAAI
jgi:hypothetical protein